MKKTYAFLMLFALAFSACSEKETEVPQNTTDVVTYTVTLTNSANWSGSYLDENNNRVTVSNQASGWSVTFTNRAAKPRSLEIRAIAAAPTGGATATIVGNISVNNGIVASQSNGSTATASPANVTTTATLN
jgi:hypothetical protein